MDAGSYWPGYRSPMQLREIMTAGVVTRGRRRRRARRRPADARPLGRLGRHLRRGGRAGGDGHRPRPRPCARSPRSARRASRSPSTASRPLVTGEPEMDLEEAAALMVQHRIRRLPDRRGRAPGRDRHPRRHRRAHRQPRGRPADDPGSDRGRPARLLLPRARLTDADVALDPPAAAHPRPLRGADRPRRAGSRPGARRRRPGLADRRAATTTTCRSARRPTGSSSSRASRRSPRARSG